METLQQQKTPQKTSYGSRSPMSDAAISHPSRTIVHAKLEMTEPGDHDEQEADAAANDIVNGGKIRRKISNGGGSGVSVSPQVESQIAQLQGGGHTMPAGLRNMMENGFGRDFSQVRLHTDSQAADMSSSISARAFTHGNDIYFNRGQFSPNTSEGQRLVAHELTHVAQGTGKVGREEEESSDYYTYLFDKEGYCLGKQSSQKEQNDTVSITIGDKIINTALHIDDFLIIVGTIKHEGSNQNDNEEELLWIAHTANNAAKQDKQTLYYKLSSGFSSVPEKKKNEYKEMNDKKPEDLENLMKKPRPESTSKDIKFQRARKALISVLTNEADPTGGATRWDGRDFAIGLKAGRHAKLNQNKTIIINQDIFNTYMRNCNCEKALINKLKYKTENNVIFISGNYKEGSIKATGTKGQTIFWIKNRKDRNDYWNTAKGESSKQTNTIDRQIFDNGTSKITNIVSFILEKYSKILENIKNNYLQSLILKYALKRGADSKISLQNNKIAVSYKKYEENAKNAKTYTPFPSLVYAKTSTDLDGEYELTDAAIMRGTKCNFFVGEVLFEAYRDFIELFGNIDEKAISNEETISFFKKELNILQNIKYDKYEGAKKMGEKVLKNQKQIKNTKDIIAGDIIWWNDGSHIEIVVGKYNEAAQTIKCMGAHEKGAYAKDRKIQQEGEDFYSKEKPEGKVIFYRMTQLPNLN